ncbi:hypothetical protein HDE_00620 [Halotydeus destructor]|nr:hypothetical protein HDE_00620 [Halotydeus destructor]
MGDMPLDVTFFDKLRKGVRHIELSVKDLKNQAENEFNKYSSLSQSDYDKIKNFESQVRSTYTETALLLGTMKSDTCNLDKIEEGLLGLEAEIDHFVQQGNLMKYGYKLWQNPCPVFIPDETEYELPEIVVDESKEVEVLNVAQVKEEVAPQLPSPTPTVTIARHDSPKVAAKKFTPRQSNENKKRPEKFNRTPQPFDFGIVNTRRFTMLPKTMLKQKETTYVVGDDRDCSVDSYQETKAVSYMNQTKSINPFASESTTMFNIPSIAMAKYDVPTTPNMSEMYSQDQITVEFTPGLTTKRPTGLRRARSKPSVGEEVSLPKEMPERTRSLREINLDYEKHLPATPKQPIVSKSVMESAKLIKSVKKSQLTDTPQMPSLSIDHNLHRRIIPNRYK